MYTCICMYNAHKTCIHIGIYTHLYTSTCLYLDIDIYIRFYEIMLKKTQLIIKMRIKGKLIFLCCYKWKLVNLNMLDLYLFI